jgi:predicted PhzF superfamily epimerase YddE/YHI9
MEGLGNNQAAQAAATAQMPEVAQAALVIPTVSQWPKGVVIPLKEPVKVDGHDYRYVDMRRCKVKDKKLASLGAETNADYEVRLFANLCGITMAVMDELDEVDYNQVSETYRGFLKPAKPVLEVQK